jgi:hypothetical protein
LSNQNPCRSIKRPNISIRKAKMVVAELNAREKALEKRNWLRSNTAKQNLSQKNQNLSLVSM